MSRLGERISLRLGVFAAIAISVFGVASAVAAAAEPAPHWLMMSQPAPSYFHAGDPHDFYEVVAVNDGAADTSGEVTFTDTLPEGVTVNEINAYGETAGTDGGFEAATCSPVTSDNVVTVTCSTTSSVPIGRMFVANINVSVPGDAATPLLNSAVISGGDAPTASVANSTRVTSASEAVPYGSSIASEMTSESGEIATQAGSHPFAFTTLLAFPVASVTSVPASESCFPIHTSDCAQLNAETKDVKVNLPAGFVGNPNPNNVPYCTQAQFEKESFRGCPASTQVGSLYLFFYGGTGKSQYAPVYNIEPPPGQPAEFGFSVSTVAHVPIFFHVRNGGDYGLSADVSNITQFDPVRMLQLSIWGVPAASAHDALRLSELEGCGSGSGCVSKIAKKPFLSMPTSCTGGSLKIPVMGDSWQGAVPALDMLPILTEADVAGMTGCEALSFAPTLSVSATTSQAASPSGYDVHITVPQNNEVSGLSTPDVRGVEVELPPGTVVSPSAAKGLQACTEAQFGLKIGAKGGCTNESKIGKVTITTPLLEQPMQGSVFVGQPECSPCSSAQAEAGQMLPLLLEAEGSGVVIKLLGHTHIDQATGQLTTVFSENPQLPFSDLDLTLEDGPDAPLANPSACGPAISTGHLTPWSTMTAAYVSAPAIPISGCSVPGFTPSFEAGMTKTAQAGAFSGFSVTLSRPDRQQDLRSVTVSTPPGLIGMLSKVTRCGEAQANAGTCPASSQIGTSSATVGPGTEPLTITGGKVFLTGPYANKPFGLSIVDPAEAGPFKLAGTNGAGQVVVRSSVAVNPYSSALTIVSNELPTGLDGIPLDIRAVNINVDREGFMFNPTNCNAMAVGGSLTSTSGTVANVSYPFQAVNCATLAYKPSFGVSAGAKFDRADGASINLRIAPGAGQANTSKVRLVFPKQLPTRLSTLKLACVARVFETNPASCPVGSVVGSAIAHTPVLSSALTGPIYLVSHGGAAFPDAEIVLQGEGITLIMDGKTDIVKGVTSSTFETVPDAPFSTFEAHLPGGPHSAFAAIIAGKAKGSLCGKLLSFGSVFVGQNGVQLKRSTKVSVSGCPKVKKSVKPKHKAKAKTKAKK